MQDKFSVKIISKDKVNEPMPKRDDFYTTRTVMKIDKFQVIVKSNKPSYEAIRNFNKEFIRIVTKKILEENK